MKILERFGTIFHHRVLDNGVNLFLFERKGMPIHLRASFYAGSRFDTVPGTAHFLEHMLVAGSKRFPSKNLFADYLQRIGGDFGASTDADFLRLHVEIPMKEDIAMGLEVIEECLVNSLFDQKTFETERGAILSELKAKKSNPKEFIWDVSRKLSMQGTSLSNTNLGTQETIKAIDIGAVLDFYKTYIHSGRLVFVACGDIDVDEISSGLNKIKLPVGDKFAINEPLQVIRDTDTMVEIYPNLDQLQVILSIRLLISSYSEYCSLQIINNSLAVGRGSRLMSKLRYMKGLVYLVNGSMTTAGDWGVMRFQFSCDKSNLEAVRKIILDEFEDLRRNGLSVAELEIAKAKSSKGSIRDMQTSQSWVAKHENMAMFYPNEFMTIEDHIVAVNSLSSDDISNSIAKYLLEDQIYTAICGDL